MISIANIVYNVLAGGKSTLFLNLLRGLGVGSTNSATEECEEKDKWEDNK